MRKIKNADVDKKVVSQCVSNYSARRYRYNYTKPEDIKMSCIEKSRTNLQPKDKCQVVTDGYTKLYFDVNEEPSKYLSFNNDIVELVEGESHLSYTDEKFLKIKVISTTGIFSVAIGRDFVIKAKKAKFNSECYAQL